MDAKINREHSETGKKVLASASIRVFRGLGQACHRHVFFEPVLTAIEILILDPRGFRSKT